MLNSEQVLLYMQQESYRPLSYQELIEILNILPENEPKFSRVLGKMEKEGMIVKTRKNKYGLPEMMNLNRGVIKLSQRGYGIFSPDNAGQPEIFIYGRDLNGAMHNDRVLVRMQQRGYEQQRPEGEVVRVIARHSKEMVGTVKRGKNIWQVIPDDTRQIYPIYVHPGKKIKVKNGDRVLVKITLWPDKNRAPEGKIIEILGNKNSPDLALRVVIKKHHLREEFSSGVLEEAHEAAAISPGGNRDEYRRDLRTWNMVTIDGEDAKDLDDAVSISKIDEYYRLGVHIADVAHYVRENTGLDKEALARGTSVYLIDKVLPMLPPEISNGICSLNAKEERLAISCIMDIDPGGEVKNYEIIKSLINVKERMTYTAVNKILAGEDQELNKYYQEQIPSLILMQQLAEILRQRRMERGALDFDFPETKIIADENSFPLEIKKAERGAAERIIEDFMIKANEVVAEHLFKLEAPLLYRVHEKPDEEAVVKLNQILGVFGRKIKKEKVSPSDLQKILQQVQGRPEEQLIALMILRSMKHACYAPQALGHFGLASPYYCHFTSPIRRYPDLIVHRVLSSILNKNYNAEKKEQFAKKMAYWGEHLTIQEIKAEEAERELIDVKKAQYMQQFIGDTFTGKIVSVLAFGFFVALDNTVEGLVHISSIADDYYIYNDRNFTLVGKHGGRQFAIGDQVTVQLVRVNVEEAKIDFELI